MSLYRREDFHQFLYSVIREEEGGASLTVLSALARHNLDPWEAAEELTRVPWAVAATQLSSNLRSPCDRFAGKAASSVDRRAAHNGSDVGVADPHSYEVKGAS